MVSLGAAFKVARDICLGDKLLPKAAFLPGPIIKLIPSMTKVTNSLETILEQVTSNPKRITYKSFNHIIDNHKHPLKLVPVPKQGGTKYNLISYILFGDFNHTL